MSENKNMSKPNRKTPIWLEFLGSMNLAITLLVMLSIASVIGTVLQQNQVIQDYIIKFGPFWHEVYSQLDLYSVYGASWFMLVLLFLLVSTGVCVSRNTPVFIKDMKQFSEKLSLNALKHQPNHVSFTLDQTTENLQQHAIKTLKSHGFRYRTHQKEDGSITLAGLKGHWNRLGYFFSHISIIIICIGALMDGNLYLKFSEWTGNLAPETRNVSLNDVDPKAWLSADNYSYRGNVNITEGRDADVLFLPYGDGYLVQQLPFRIEVTDFRLDYYDNGMPKSYESDILLYADDLEEPLAKTIEVNHPLYYKDYAIYQSSYGDGGSKVNFNVHALASPNISNSVVESAINKNESLTTPVGQFRIEFTDFKLYNIVPRDKEEAELTGRKMQNNGPSVLFKVRNEQGKAWEYENFMIPNKQEDRWFFMSGVRTSVAEPFRYLFIPADANRSKDRFFKFLALLNNPQARETVLSNMVPKPENMEESTYQTQLRLFGQLINLFRQTGFDGIARFVETNVPQDQQEQVMAFYYDQLASSLQTLYLHILDEEGIIRDDADNINQEHQLWFEDALTAIASLHRYGPPLFFELTSFEQIQSTGLQITKSPGKDVVYFGSAMLIMGVFFMFYVRQRRVWIHLKSAGDKTEVTIAGKDNKKLPETEEEFQKFVTQLKS
ncbi:cytochrome c biogenesis protein ResB [Thiomicrospira sp.]|uniref:cytochrome c biogenesis protein ResB n=1 Tax=Thiomicrospira sp. TaxID=935 RepID=UPI002F95EB0E